MKKIYLKHSIRCLSILLLTFNCFLSQYTYAQQAYVSDDEVSSIFVSGGYGALFGAAMGAALLPFMNSSPTQNLRIVAGGASIGFMVGSAYGFYSLANASKNSYFNYNNQDDDTNFYYSMPPSMPTHGNNLKNNKVKPGLDVNKTPVVGALFMGDGKNIDLAVPYFWVADNKVSIMLAYLTF